MADRYGFATYVIRRKFWKLFGAAFHIYDPNGNVVLYSKQKAFKLKEDIRIYSNEDMREEVLTIQARQIIDFSAAYDVLDPASGQKVGALKRKGWSSLVRDEWIFMDVHDREIGTIQEDSMTMALVRRFLTNLIPQSYEARLHDHPTPIAKFHQNFNPFVLKITLDFSSDLERRLDRRLGLAAAILLCAVEGRQG